MRRFRLLGRLFYYALFIAILAAPVVGYLAWLRDYWLSHPKVIEAVPFDYVEEQPMEGILLWDEELAYAPQDGVYTYLSPRPRRVAKGEMVAALDGMPVRAPYPAYFYPALDGQEGRWLYSHLWPNFAPFPFFRPAVLLENGIQLRRGAPIGKWVPQPQDLRCIAYLDHTPSLERSLKRENAEIQIKMEPDGKARKAAVLTVKSPQGEVKENERKVKIYLRLPFFPPALLRSRGFSAWVVTEAQQGVVVPDSSVVTRGGRNRVFLLQGNRIVSKDIEGFPARKGSFFIAKGVSPGNRLILEADNVQEGVLRIW